ncbi:MAG: sulfite oxidase [Lapillicoccus sp.]
MWEKRSDMVVHEEDPYNAEPPPAALAGHPLTTADTFYSRNHGGVPHVSASAWRLRVDGLVATPLELTLEDLRRRFPEQHVTATLQCAGARRAAMDAVRPIPGEALWGPTATSTAAWTGVRLADVLAAAGVADSAAHVAFWAPDVALDARPPQEFGGSIPLAKAEASEVLLAWAMNGEPLPAVHGGPVRVVVPGYIGARSVKWVDRVTVQSEPSASWFQAVVYRLLPADVDPATAPPGTGFSLGPVALNSDVLSPADGAQVPAGPTTLQGYAFAGGDRSVARVDVSVDGGTTWVQADLEPPAGPWTWALWSTTTVLQPGEAEVVVRAWDDTAACQPESAASLWNPKGYVNNAWGRIRLHVGGLA